MILLKAIIPLGLAAGLLFRATAFAAFPDVQSSHANYDAIVYVQAQGIVSGYPDGSFRPNQTINRAEFVKILVDANESSLLIENIDKNSPMSFPDVRPENWFHQYVYSAFYNDVIAGYPDGTFKPENSINFVEAAKMLAIVDHIPQEPLEGTEWHPLAPATGEAWYRRYVDYLAQRNVISISINSFDQKITRGEMAEIVYRLKAGITNKPSRTYNDLNKQQTNSVSATWKIYQNPYFNYQLQYSDRYRVRYQDDDPNRDIFGIELKKENFPTGKDVNFQGASIRVIANKDNKSRNDECYTRPDSTAKNINGTTFNFIQINITNDLETQAVTQVEYQLKNSKGCFLILSSIAQATLDIETYKQYVLLPDQELQKIISEVQNIISTFKFTDVNLRF